MSDENSKWMPSRLAKTIRRSYRLFRRGPSARRAHEALGRYSFPPRIRRVVALGVAAGVLGVDVRPKVLRRRLAPLAEILDGCV